MYSTGKRIIVYAIPGRIAKLKGSIRLYPVDKPRLINSLMAILVQLLIELLRKELSLRAKISLHIKTVSGLWVIKLSSRKPHSTQRKSVVSAD